MAGSPEYDQVRIGTAEREESAKLLADHYGEGRLTSDEYEARVLDAYQATLRSELRSLFQDLPQPHPAFLAPPPAPFTPPPAMPFAPPPMLYAPPPMPMPYQQMYSPRSKTVAGVLQIVLPFGIGRFYTGQVGLGLLQQFVCLITFGAGALWPVIDGILLLVNGGTDAQGRPLRP